MFLALGWLLFAWHNVISHTLLHAENLAASLYPDNLWRQKLFLNAATLAFALVMFLCFITAWGLKRLRSWARSTGVAAERHWQALGLAAKPYASSACPIPA
jgi:hypothetical protein